jgi:hypothetical protein
MSSEKIPSTVLTQARGFFASAQLGRRLRIRVHFCRIHSPLTISDTRKGHIRSRGPLLGLGCTFVLCRF